MSRHLHVAILFLLLGVQTASAQPDLNVTLPGGATLEMLWIEPGTFLFGSPESEPGRREGEFPPTETRIERGFYIGRYELTQAQWVSVMDTRPWRHNVFPDRLLDGVAEGPDYPASYLSWVDAQEFVQTLRSMTGDTYRLPTEREWEYAARAGTASAWHFGADARDLATHAWFTENARDELLAGHPRPVGGKRPNPWGLYDVHGNVSEWCQDPFVAFGADASESDTRILRGGAYFHHSELTRAAHRGRDARGQRWRGFGLRLVREGEHPTHVTPHSWGRIKRTPRDVPHLNSHQP